MRPIFVCPPVWRVAAGEFYAPGARERAERSLAVTRKLQEMGVATPELNEAAAKLRNALGGGR